MNTEIPVRVFDVILSSYAGVQTNWTYQKWMGATHFEQMDYLERAAKAEPLSPCEPGQYHIAPKGLTIEEYFDAVLYETAFESIVDFAASFLSVKLMGSRDRIENTRQLEVWLGGMADMIDILTSDPDPDNPDLTDYYREIRWSFSGDVFERLQTEAKVRLMEMIADAECGAEAQMVALLKEEVDDPDLSSWMSG